MSLTNEEMLQYAEKYIETNGEADVSDADCDTIEYLLENCEITIPTGNRFFVNVNCKNIRSHIINKRGRKYHDEIKNSPLGAGIANRTYTGFYDFGHTTTEWNSVIQLGIAGLKKRITDYADKNKADEKKQKFYSQLIRVYVASLKFIKRSADVAKSQGKYEMAEGLFNLAENAPRNLFEAMQTSIIYYTLQQFFDGTILRTLGRLDSLFYPFFIREDEKTAKKLMLDFLKEIDSWNAQSNIPFAIGGTDQKGNCLINKLSYMILDTYEKAQTSNVKIHLLCSDNMPSDLIEKAFISVRNGNNSIVFMSDKKIIESLEKLGEEKEDAVDYHVVGCYECGGNGEITCSCNGKLNIPKALEYALNGGRDMITNELIGLENNGIFNCFEDLYCEFERQLVHLCNCVMKVTDLHEMHYRKMHFAPIISGTYTSALENGRDIYCDYGAKYNNSSVNGMGIATAVDSLAAIRKAVFEDKILTLDEFVEILKSNWNGKEPLRLLIKNKFPKYGVGDKKTDIIAKNIVDTMSYAINGKPNVKGGKYRLGMFSINWRWEFGAQTAATADGRLSGDPLSQNTGASFGADKEGATAHLISATTIDASKTPNGAIVDLDLHSSAVRGKNGLNTLVSTLKTYFDMGGFAIHYNILDTEVLKDAKINPEKYPNLQVRLCGWNVLFSSLSEKEKDEFIMRSIR